MSDTTGVAGKAGPVISEGIEEIQGVFPSDAALQDAIARLTQAGFDRAEISIPSAFPAPGDATPEQGAANPNTETDTRQARTLQSSLAASAGALAAAGVVIATGGAALPAVAAAVAGGVGLGAAAEGVSRASDTRQHDEREEAAGRGELVLSVTLRAPDRANAAESAMKEAGATRIARVRRAP